jgi:hypothetical protein
MPDSHRPAMPQVTTVDDLFGAHRFRNGLVLRTKNATHESEDASCRSPLPPQ